MLFCLKDKDATLTKIFYPCKYTLETVYKSGYIPQLIMNHLPQYHLSHSNIMKDITVRYITKILQTKSEANGYLQVSWKTVYQSMLITAEPL